MAHSHSPPLGKRLVLKAFKAFGGSSTGSVPTPWLKAKEVRRILVVELWNIGDVVLLLPFLAQLRAKFPHAEITLLARPHARIILAGTGLADEYLDDAAPSENWLSLNPASHGWRDLWRLRSQLRSRDFDLAFQCRLHLREHVILSMSGARRRIGYAFGEGDGLLTDALVVDDPHRHKSDDWLQLLEPLGGTVATESPALHVSADERQAAEELLMREGVGPGDTVIGIHPGASLPEKRWPIERFAGVARELASRSGARVVTFVDPAGYGDSLGDIDRVVKVKPDLRGLIALIDRCALLVCNDSGPMHLAGALGTPAVAVFGSGIARWFAPLGEGHELVNSDDGEIGGLGGVTTEMVLAAVSRRAPGISLPSTPPLSAS